MRADDDVLTVGYSGSCVSLIYLLAWDEVVLERLLCW